MARPDPDLEYTLELLEPLGPVRSRAMFGGWGLYLEGSMFGVMIQRRLYLKTDDTTRPAFESAGGEPFVYDSGGKPVTMSYWTPPPDASDDAHALLPWARRAVEAAHRAAAKKKKPAPAREAPAAKKTPAARKKASVKKASVKKSSRRA